MCGFIFTMEAFQSNIRLFAHHTRRSERSTHTKDDFGFCSVFNIMDAAEWSQGLES